MLTRVLASSLAVGLSIAPGLAADMNVLKAPPAPAPASPWDLAFGSAVMSDYNFRGITQSNHKPSVAAYFEPRYNFTDTLQGYIGVSGESISFPNRAAAEIDFYGGIRPTFGKLALDFGVWEYWYPGGQCFNALVAGDCATNADPLTGGLPVNGNVVKADLSFLEGYGKFTYTVNDQFSFGGSAFYSPSVLNSGADGTYVTGNLKYTLPNIGFGIGWFLSGDVGHWFLGTSDSFYGFPAPYLGGLYAAGIPYKSYTNWDAGLAFTWKQFTLDLRYFDTDLNKGDCNAFTTAQTATLSGNVTPINPSGAGTNWCGATFIAKLSVDLTLGNLK